jgi:hypothetical protein
MWRFCPGCAVEVFGGGYCPDCLELRDEFDGRFRARSGSRALHAGGRGAANGSAVQTATAAAVWLGPLVLWVVAAWAVWVAVEKLRGK